jgi:hypothetical protein
MREGFLRGQKYFQGNERFEHFTSTKSEKRTFIPNPGKVSFSTNFENEELSYHPTSFQ